MPELPEVETIRRQLNENLVGQKVVEVEILNLKSWSGDKDMVIGSEVVGVRRKGKALIVDLMSVVNGQLSLVIHLKMTGQLIYENHELGIRNYGSSEERLNEHLKHRFAGGHPTADFVGQLPSKHTRVIIKFRGPHPDPLLKGEGVSPSYFKRGLGGVKRNHYSGTLFFNDQRKFGWIKLMPSNAVGKLKFIESLGKEPWDFTPEEWTKLLQASKKPIKVRLMDQNVIAGVGNIYANDACWEAKIDPRRPANSLNPTETVLLLEKVKLVLDEGIKYGGATAANYVNLHGLGGKYQEHFRVYQRGGEPCIREDGGVIEKVTLGGRGTFWCQKCQV